MRMEIKLSDYAKKLDLTSKKRYLDKITLIGVDPFALTSAQLCDAVVPSVEAADLVNYLVLSTSHYTTAQFKAYKSLESYNHFVSGWVTDVRGWTSENFCVVVGKVC